MDFHVYKSDDGRMCVRSDYDDFIASYKHGEWTRDLVFDRYEMQELPPVEDAQEALHIVKEAKRALQSR